MRNSIILSDEYRLLFLQETERSGLISPTFDNMEKAVDNDDHFYTTPQFTEKKKNLLRLILLYDEIIIPQVPNSYDFHRLTNEDNFKILLFEDYLDKSEIHKESMKLFAPDLKPVLLPLLIKRLKRYFRASPLDINFTEFASEFYDSALFGKTLDPKYNNFMLVNDILFHLRTDKFYEQIKSEMSFDQIFYNHISAMIISLIEDLYYLLEASSDNNATILSCNYHLDNIGLGSPSNELESTMKTYRILRLECKRALGVLPEINTIQEVMTLKRQKNVI